MRGGHFELRAFIKTARALHACAIWRRTRAKIRAMAGCVGTSSCGVIYQSDIVWGYCARFKNVKMKTGGPTAVSEVRIYILLF